MEFMTSEWASAYTQIWNNDSIVTKKLRKFSSVFQFVVTDRDDLESVVIEVENGICITYGTEEQYDNIDFFISGDTNSWKNIYNHEISIKKAMKNFSFKGSKLKAMMNMSGLERGIELMREMEDVKI